MFILCNWEKNEFRTCINVYHQYPTMYWIPLNSSLLINTNKTYFISGLDQAVTESHFCCSSLDIFLMEKVRKSCFIWLCRALKVLLNGPSSNFPRKWFLGKKVKKHACYGITQNYHLFSTTLIKYHFHAVPATFFQKFLYHVVGKFVLHRFHHKVRCWIS